MSFIPPFLLAWDMGLLARLGEVAYHSLYEGSLWSSSFFEMLRNPKKLNLIFTKKFNPRHESARLSQCIPFLV